MKLQFKHQKFQAEAAKAVVDVFAGQPYLRPSYKMDRGAYQQTLTEDEDYTGWGNHRLIQELSDELILSNIRKIQRAQQIAPSTKLEGRYNLSIEMETGVGKTYTYIKTMYELNKAYGWSKFIVVVPSIAIREGVYKSFQITQEHFAEDYGKKIRFFIYNSARLTEIDRFASDSSIHVMIINSQAFNAKGKDARRIYMKLDEFRSRRPIDIIAKTNPILIIDEPQSVEGKQTKESLKQFNPLLTLRYSATHKKDSIYNMIYRLDAMEAYNKRLVKKIAVKGITESGRSDTDSYVYLEAINLSKAAPRATLQFNCAGAKGIRKITRVVSEGYNLYEQSGHMEEYREGFVVARIDGRDDSVEFINGIKLYAGDVIGRVSEDELRRIQIRETILSHIQRERELYDKGIKVLSLFFIDEVAKYRLYDEAGEARNGSYAQMFEEEYHSIIGGLDRAGLDEAYLSYLDAISADRTHAGYFSIDKRGQMIDSKLVRKETSSDDVDAYELIMKNKELLLDRDPHRSPVRFIFSHSALREGWDNPNVFQICTLKKSSSDTRKRQEVGRGLRLSVNQDGERMDINALGAEVHSVNVLTVIASESYESFAKGLQEDMAEAVADRPRAVTAGLFIGRLLRSEEGCEELIDEEMGHAIYFDLIRKGYIDKKGALTESYYEDRASGAVTIAEEAGAFVASVIAIIDSIYDERVLMAEDARKDNVELNIDEEKLALPEFKELWTRINSKSFYVVDFDTEELVERAVDSLNKKLHVPKTYFRVETGVIDKIESKEELMMGASMVKAEGRVYHYTSSESSNVEYDLIGRLVDNTGLTRKAVSRILQGIEAEVFHQFRLNPEEFIIRAAALINEEKATAIIEHITYDVLDDKYDTRIFTSPSVKGRLGKNAMKAKKHLYDHLVYDSASEENFARELDSDKDVAVYVKLPGGFYISTPVGRYNPDWAIAFYEDNIKHIYFIAETKGSMNSLQLRLIEEAKIHCAREHFRAISKGNVVYDVVDSYKSLLEKVMR